MTLFTNKFRTLLGTLALWAAAVSPVLAQAAPNNAPVDKSYVSAYGLVILLVGLGLMLVLRPAGRATEARPKKGE